jgi:hypothetical protein
MGGTRRGATVSVTTRRRSPDDGDGPCLFLVACGCRPQLSPLRVELGLRARVDLRRGEALDAVARNGEPPSIELAIPDAKISARHARLEHCLDRWCVTDEQSKNGTFVNGARVTQHVLSDGDVVAVAERAGSAR